MSSPPSDPSSGGGDGGSAVPGTASSNFTLLYIIIAVLVGVILYMAIRYGRSVMSEWRQLQAGGGGGEPRAALLGLSSDDIDALPTFTYRARGAAASPLVGGGGRRGGGSGKGKGATTVVVECVVCLQELADGDVVRVLPACRHFFHGGCIDLWLRAHSTCPVCRAHPEPDGVRLSDVVVVSPPLPQLRRCGLSPERPTAASRALADILARSPLRGNTTSTTTTTTTGGPITSTSSKSPSSPVQAAIINYVQASRSPSPTAYHSLNERWPSSPTPVVVVRSKSPSPSSPPIGGLSLQTTTAAAARGVGVVEGVDAGATTSASASAPTQVVALSREGGGSRSKSPSPVPH
uniref:RING-type E3 ubiquitin transferase n=1 Tax=Oryza rufipogon TaxID=4529 RepID=A0A0E0PYR2_ORYRU